MPIPQLCEDCYAFFEWLSSYPGYREPYRYPKDGASIKRSSGDCSFCERLIKYRLHDFGDVQTVEMQVRKDWDGLISTVQVTYRFEPKHFAMMDLYIWADEGSQAHIKGRICTLPAIDKYGSRDTVDTIRHWLQRCLREHRACRYSLTGDCIDEDSAMIPAERILNVGDATSDSIKLVKTNGLIGKYVALSHCWGPPEKRPVCVTKENESQYFGGVPDTQLPKTFRDAINLIRGLGIRYLWIDSLCIVQDSREHWHQESTRMGLIYERAYLRIAASGAHNSTEGLFDDTARIHRVPTLRFPYIEGESATQDCIYVGMDTGSGDDPWNGPLSTRAWAFQESRLARRNVSTMPKGISWVCQEMNLNERNCFSYDYRDSQFDWFTWEENVCTYSYGKLTYESDRLVAIQGLANEIAKTRADQYFLGIWTGEAPRQLLWSIFHLDQGMEGLLELPSWTWACHAGSKQYLHKDFPIAPDEDQIGSRFISLCENTNTLTFEGSIFQCILADRDVKGEDFAFQPTCPESMLVTHWSTNRRLIWADIGKERVPIGLVHLDESTENTILFCSIMLVADRQLPDPLRKWEVDDRTLSLFVDKPGSELRALEPLDSNKANPSDWDLIRKYGKSTSYYWILVMRPSLEENTFTRAGMGIMWPSDFVDNRPSEQIFHLC